MNRGVANLSLLPIQQYINDTPSTTEISEPLCIRVVHRHCCKIFYLSATTDDKDITKDFNVSAIFEKHDTRTDLVARNYEIHEGEYSNKTTNVVATVLQVTKNFLAS